MELRIEDGKMVCLDYTLSLPDGTIVDSAQQSGTWTYVHGETHMPPGLAKGVEGLKTGDEVRLELEPEDAFGATNPDAFQDLPKDRFPNAILQVGYEGELPGPGGTIIPYRIHAIGDETVTLDLNHPLAGQAIVFDVTIIHIQN